MEETDEENDEAGKGGENPTAIPSFGEMWDSMKTIMAQLVVLTQAVLPAGMPSKGTDGRIRQAVTQSGNTVRNSTEVIEIDPPVRAVRKVDYLSLLEHISWLRTKHFSGSSNPIEADEWRSRLVRNFRSTRCPEDYKLSLIHI